MTVRRTSDTHGRPDGSRLRLSDPVMAAVRLGHEHPDCPYETARALDLAVCTSAANRRYTFDDVYRAYILDHRFEKAARAFREVEVRRGRQAAMTYLLGRWRVAERRVRDQPPVIDAGVVEHWIEVVDLVVSARLPGKGGPACAALIVAIAHQGLLWRTVQPAISRIALEITSGMTRTRTETAIKTAINEGIVRAFEPEIEGWRTRWAVDVDRLRERAAAIEGGCPEVLGRNRNHPALLLWEDVWHEAALGLAGWRLYVALAWIGQADVATLAAAVGGNAVVVRKRLRQLEAAGLVCLEVDQWSVTQRPLAEAAARNGWTGLAEARELALLADHEDRDKWYEGRRRAVAKVREGRQRRNHSRATDESS